MAEDDFYSINGNSYRGSRYANFAGGGVDAQGNVSSSVVENQSNNNANTPSQQTTSVGSDATDFSNKGVELGNINTDPKPTAPLSASENVTNAGISTAVPFAASSIGGTIGGNVAAGATGSEVFKNLGSDIYGRVSSGLLGSGASTTATNAALSGMGSSYGPASQAAVSKAGNTGAIGSASNIGAGIGTAAATLLTGGSVKDAAFQGVGAYAGATLGSTFGPAGTAVGSFIGSTIGKFIGGAFGGGMPRSTLAAYITPDESGKLSTSQVSNKGLDNKSATSYGNSITGILNSFAENTGLKFKSSFKSETNLGKKDVKSTYGNTSVSGKGGDAGSVALSVLKDRNAYSLGDDADFNSFWDNALGSASDIGSFGSAIDGYYASKNLTAAPTVAAQNGNLRRTGDKYATFYS